MLSLRTPRRCALLLVFLLCLVAAPTAAAADEPSVATPKTYRYRADVALTLGPESATATGDGEVDLVRQALRLTIVSTSGGRQSRLQLILVDNRLYLYNEQRQRWEYVDLRDSGTPGTVPQSTLPQSTLPKHPTAPYVPSGTEQIDGMTTNRWRADGRYNALLPLLSPREFAGILVEEQLTAEAAIGATDRYLYRLNVKEDGTTTTLGTTPPQRQAVKSDATYRYSEFDRPVTITAPPDAVPLPNGPSTTLREAETPFARAAQQPDRDILDAALAMILPAGLPLP